VKPATDVGAGSSWPTPTWPVADLERDRRRVRPPRSRGRRGPTWAPRYGYDGLSGVALPW